MRASLARDLRGEPAPLLGAVAPPPSLADAPAAAEDRVLAEGERIRALRPARPRAPGHVILEARGGESLAGADAGLLAELARFTGRFAAELSAHGAARLEADLAGPLRWHLLAGG
jgi:diadenosine tetraphosphate (Ap4A) HIT family hydrolase